MTDREGAFPWQDTFFLAEDDKALSALMQDFFRAAGVAVTPAYDGEQALVLAQEQPFDLLVLDVMMPHLNGLEVCEAVRQESDVPVIFVTALGQEGDTLAGVPRGRGRLYHQAVFVSGAGSKGAGAHAAGPRAAAGRE